MTASPSTIRAAAYLRYKRDAAKRTGKRRGKLKCVAPNRVCGSRCIPPEWNCRLKGEGQDPHLLAAGKGADVVGGLANIERGAGRIKKGVLKLSFSEIEGGRRAISRGVSKATPGDLKRKAAVRGVVDTAFKYLSGPVGIAILGALTHKGLKNFPAYQRGWGQQVDNAARDAWFSAVRRNPLSNFGTNEAAAAANINRARESFAGLAGGTPAALTQGAARRTTVAGITGEARGLTEVTVPVQTALRKADLRPNGGGASGENYPEWQRKSLVAFADVKRRQEDNPPYIGKIGSVYSMPAANRLYADSFGIDLGTGLDLSAQRKRVVLGVQRRLEDTGNSLRTAAVQQGIDIKDPAAVRAFVDRHSRASLIDREQDQAWRDVVANTVINKDYQKQAQNLYSRTVQGYDDFFRSVAQDIEQAPSISLVRNRTSAPDRALFNNARQNSFYNDATRAHAQTLASTMGLPEGVHGTYTAGLVSKAYHNANVAMPGAKRRPNSSVFIELTPVEATNAASELARARGLPEPDRADAALQLLNDHYGSTRSASSGGLANISLVRPAAPRTRPQAVGPGAQPAAPRKARRRLRTKAEIMATLQQSGGLSLEAAEREAERIISARGDSEAPLFSPRLEAYLRTRADLREGTGSRGKPCGASHIPKAHKCGKGAAAAAQPAATEKKEESKRKGLSPTQIAAIAAVGAVAVTGIVVAADVNKVWNSGSPLAASPPIRDVIRASKKEFGVKSTQEALGEYYTKKSGLKPGDVVYYRPEGDSNAHYAVYLGAGNDGSVRAVMMGGGSERRTIAGVFTVGVTKGAEVSEYDDFMTIPPMLKAPPLKGATKFSGKETVQRALRVVGESYDYTMVKNNCETLANSIAYGTPRSSQLEQLTKFSRVALANTQGRIESAKTAYKLRRVGETERQNDATDLIKKLAASDTAFGNSYGKELARDYYTQFFLDGSKHYNRRQTLAGRRANAQGRLRRTDAAQPGTLLSPEAFWNNIKGLEPARQKVLIRDYLVVARFTGAQPANNDRTDARKNYKRGQKCGNSYIPKDHKCNPDGPGKTAAKVALVAGAAAATVYGLKKARLGEFHTGLARNTIDVNPRKRRFSFMEKHSPTLTSDQMAEQFNRLRGQPGVISENVDALSNFVTKNGIRSDPKTFWTELNESLIDKLPEMPADVRNTAVKKMRMLTNLGAVDGLAGITSDNIYVRSNRKDINKLDADPAVVTKAAGSFMDARASEQLDKPKLFTIGGSAKDGDARELLNTIHEVAHKVDFQASRNAGLSNVQMASNNYYRPPYTYPKSATTLADFMEVSKTRREALKRVASGYGRSDLGLANSETFAELSVLYITQGQRFKAEHPLAYDWVDDIWKKASA